MKEIVAALVVVACWVGLARAEDAAPTIVAGRVTDVLGRAVSSVQIHVVPASGSLVKTTTDQDGRYRVEVSAGGTYRVVVENRGLQTIGTVIAKPGETTTLDITLELDSEGGEVIRIEDRELPVVNPKLRPKSQPPLPYSKEAFERDAWARAWLLLDVDETGRVTRLKLLKQPGFGLEKICIDAAFALQFEPARDAAGRPMKTYLLWTMEWPAWGWLQNGKGTTMERQPQGSNLHVFTRDQPAATIQYAPSRVPCFGSGPLRLSLRNPAYRDCSLPDMKLAETLPWITRETAATAIAELSAGERVRESREPRRSSPVAAYVGAGVTAGMIVATFVSFVKYDRYHTRIVEDSWTLPPADVVAHDEMLRDRWWRISLGMVAATVVVGGGTLFLWNRHRRYFSIHPSSQGSGASAVYTTRW